MVSSWRSKNLFSGKYFFPTSPASIIVGTFATIIPTIVIRRLKINKPFLPITARGFFSSFITLQIRLFFLNHRITIFGFGRLCATCTTCILRPGRVVYGFGRSGRTMNSFEAGFFAFLAIAGTIFGITAGGNATARVGIPNSTAVLKVVLWLVYCCLKEFLLLASLELLQQAGFMVFGQQSGLKLGVDLTLQTFKG